VRAETQTRSVCARRSRPTLQKNTRPPCAGEPFTPKTQRTRRVLFFSLPAARTPPTRLRRRRHTLSSQGGGPGPHASAEESAAVCLFSPRRRGARPFVFSCAGEAAGRVTPAPAPAPGG
jgi:hypothetical protein